MVRIGTITKTISWSSVPITTITSISQATAIRDGGGGNCGDLGNCGGGSVSDPSAVSQGGGGSVSDPAAVSITQTAVAQTSKTSLLLTLFSAGADGQSKDDASLRQADRRR
jgi:hypothetical protein